MFNVNGVKLKKEKTQIAFLQETHLNETEHIKLERLGFKYVYSSSHRFGNKRGVAILINRRLAYNGEEREGGEICAG